jgi:hypothetical protein
MSDTNTDCTCWNCAEKEFQLTDKPSSLSDSLLISKLTATNETLYRHNKELQEKVNVLEGICYSGNITFKSIDYGHGCEVKCECELNSNKPTNPPDMVEHPPHYNNHPSGVECIEVTRHMNFNLGNVVKYLWRCEEKQNYLEDLKKAAWYLNDEIKTIEEQQSSVN